MHRSIRRLLGLTAACGALAAGGAAALTAAAEATAPAAAAAAGFRADPPERWGPVYSRYHEGSRAYAVGRYLVDEEHGDRFVVDARLYDKGSPSWLCAHLEVKFEGDDLDRSYWARKCGSAGFARFSRAVTGFGVTHVSARVCYWDDETERKKYCGKWVYLYSGGEEEEEEE
ncbi:hypothetical protein GCM10010466_50110 [Planomonospora alba]|uniref:Uncharacterized protein n=1 Tax=Planomonospora alba TaxID=161354 RepID=A0ABP6NMC5_9ACTN